MCVQAVRQDAPGARPPRPCIPATHLLLVRCVPASATSPSPAPARAQPTQAAGSCVLPPSDCACTWPGPGITGPSHPDLQPAVSVLAAFFSAAWRQLMHSIAQGANACRAKQERQPGSTRASTTSLLRLQTRGATPTRRPSQTQVLADTLHAGVVPVAAHVHHDRVRTTRCSSKLGNWRSQGAAARTYCHAGRPHVTCALQADPPPACAQAMVAHLMPPRPARAQAPRALRATRLQQVPRSWSTAPG